MTTPLLLLLLRRRAFAISASPTTTPVVNGKRKLTSRRLQHRETSLPTPFMKKSFICFGTAACPIRPNLTPFMPRSPKTPPCPPEVLKVMQSFPADSNGMAVLRTVVSMLSIYDPDGEDPVAGRRPPQGRPARRPDHDRLCRMDSHQPGQGCHCTA